MKLFYLEPKAELRLLLSQDIIAASEEAGGGNILNPETPNPDDAVEDPWG